MAKTKRTKSTSKDRKSAKAKGRHHCAVRKVAERVFSPEVTPHRARLIRRFDKKWANGTVLHYHFFRSPRKWRGTPNELAAVRRAFKVWKDVGLGLEFLEVDRPSEAEIRIGFLRGDGAWSYVGREILDCAAHERTMNFGWNVANEVDTPIHEIGHTLGFPHEHQNPRSRLEWNEQAVYDYFKQSDDWDEDETYYQVIRKISTSDVDGSTWDPTSIMHYDFEADLIKAPRPYSETGIPRPTKLSDRDKSWARKFYPPLDRDYKQIRALESVRLQLSPGEQANFVVKPEATRKYNFRTFGPSDGVLVLFEKIDGKLRYVSGDDDSGVDANAGIEAKLFAGREYVVRLRVYYRGGEDFGLMMW